MKLRDSLFVKPTKKKSRPSSSSCLPRIIISHKLHNVEAIVAGIKPRDAHHLYLRIKTNGYFTNVFRIQEKNINSGTFYCVIKCPLILPRIERIEHTIILNSYGNLSVKYGGTSTKQID